LVTDQPRDLGAATRIILPGVGAFTEAARNLRERGLREALFEQAVEKEIPFLGICLGMQLLGTVGYEFQETEGLDVIPGEVRRLKPAGEDTRILTSAGTKSFSNRNAPSSMASNRATTFILCISFHLRPRDPTHLVGQTPYAEGFASVVQRGVTFGTQFHPETSQRIGFRLLKNFLQV
jgi:glutamine amidotransferase